MGAGLPRVLMSGNGVPRQAGLGLMWLKLARDAALVDKDKNNDAWITELHDKSYASASEAEREQALSYIEQYMRQKQ